MAATIAAGALVVVACGGPEEPAGTTGTSGSAGQSGASGAGASGASGASAGSSGAAGAGAAGASAGAAGGGSAGTGAAGAGAAGGGAAGSGAAGASGGAGSAGAGLAGLGGGASGAGAAGEGAAGEAGAAGISGTSGGAGSSGGGASGAGTSGTSGAGGAAPSCGDTKMNGAETDVDCGGGCAGCATGKSCVTGTDCASGVCSLMGKCVADLCQDGLKNGAETDVDCGGGTCLGCAVGGACIQASDCTSAACHVTNHVCVVDHCSDGVLSSDEEGIDCGGTLCAACGSKSCASGLQCSGRSCCATAALPAGSFQMGRGMGTDAWGSGEAIEVPEHPASVKAFSLDVFEVTVGRFRAFVDAYPGSRPKAGDGAHPKVPGSGWKSSWDAQLPVTKTEYQTVLACFTAHTWTPNPGPNESLPMGCLHWYDAFAFCAWDGGHLPLEVEWEYAAAGGSENRLYPWGADAVDPAHAVYDCAFPCDLVAAVKTPGSLPLGVGRWGHHDLAGNVWEWGLDSPETYTSGPCNDCGTPSGATHQLRGGSFFNPAELLRSAHRAFEVPDHRDNGLGVRCAR